MLEIRGRLDQIDTQIEKLFEERMRLCSEVAEYKIATGKAVYDAEREKQKIESVQAMAEGEFNKQAVAELFLQMMTLSRRYQYQTIAGRVGGPDLGFHKVEKLETAGKRVVFQGLEGAYGHAAALQFFGKDADIHHVRRSSGFGPYYIDHTTAIWPQHFAAAFPGLVIPPFRDPCRIRDKLP